MAELEFVGTVKIRKKKKGYALIHLYHQGFALTARAKGMAYNLPNDHEVVLEISYVDSKGNPAQVDGDVSWQTSDAEVAQVTVGSDSTQVTVTPGARLGTAQITATADADLGEGTREIVTTIDVTIVAGEAVAGTISPVGPPTPINP